MVLDFMFKVLLVSYPILGHYLGWCVPEKKKDVNKLACEGGAIAGNIFLMGTENSFDLFLQISEENETHPPFMFKQDPYQ